MSTLKFGRINQVISLTLDLVDARTSKLTFDKNALIARHFRQFGVSFCGCFFGIMCYHFYSIYCS